MARTTGYFMSFKVDEPDKLAREVDTVTCEHCNTIFPIPPRCDPASIGGLCGTCAKIICPKCVARARCDPWEKQMQRAEARYHFRRDAGLNGD